jgi:hypothetical protein
MTHPLAVPCRLRPVLLVALVIGAGAAAQPLLSSGGSVLVSPRVVVVLWGDKVASTLPAEVQTFYEMMPSLGHWAWLSQYDTPTQQIGHATLVGTFQIIPRTPNTTLGAAAIAIELARQIDAGNLPLTSADTYYAVYVPDEISISDGEGGKLCERFSGAAYHADLGPGRVPGTFGIFPWCARNAAIAFHELFEAATDPYGNGWVTEGGAEIADVCQGFATSLLLRDGGLMELQELWSNRLDSCAASDDEFRISLSPIGAPAGPTVRFALSALGSGITPDQVSWTVSGLGDGSTYEIAFPTTGLEGTLTLHLVPPYPWIFFIEAEAGRWTASASPRLLDPVPDAGPSAPALPPALSPGPPEAPTGCSQAGDAPLPLLLALGLFASQLVLSPFRRQRQHKRQTAGRAQRVSGSGGRDGG